MKEITVPIVAIAGIVFMIWYALSQGINGAMLMSGIAVVGGLGGYEIKVLKDKRAK